MGRDHVGSERLRRVGGLEERLEWVAISSSRGSS